MAAGELLFRIALFIVSMHVFTYGSLMFHRVWSRLVAGNYEKIDARLYRYKRRKIRGTVYPAVLPGKAVDYVDGILYLRVSKRDIKTLDRFEGDYYRKEMAECTLSDRDNIIACVYVLKEEYSHFIEDEEWDPVWFSKVGIHSLLAEYEGFS